MIINIKIIKTYAGKRLEFPAENLIFDKLNKQDTLNPLLADGKNEQNLIQTSFVKNLAKQSVEISGS